MKKIFENFLSFHFFPPKEHKISINMTFFFFFLLWGFSETKFRNIAESLDLMNQSFMDTCFSGWMALEFWWNFYF